MTEFEEESEKTIEELESTITWVHYFVKEAVEKNYSRIDLSNGQYIFPHELYYCYDILQRFRIATIETRTKYINQDKDKGD